jgi:hypothetical protein
MGRVSGSTTTSAPTFIILAAGRARRYGGCKPLAPVGPVGEAVIDLVASDARRAGFGTIVLVLGPDTGPAIRYHVQHAWPKGVDVAFAWQAAPLGTVDAVLAASAYVGDTPYGVGNADDIYGLAATELLARHLRQAQPTNALVGYQMADAMVGRSPVTRGICRVDGDGRLVGLDERRLVTPLDSGDGRRGGDFSSADGRQPEIIPADARVSMNLWGFTPAFHQSLRAAMDAATEASEEAEVLLPEVVAQSLSTTTFSVLPASGRCIGVTHPDDLALVQAEVNQQIGHGDRPAALWTTAE